MVRIRATFWKRLGLWALWGLLVWMPLIFYVLVIVAEAVGWSTIGRSVGITMLVYGWPLLLVGSVSYGVLALSALLQRRWLKLAWPTAAGWGWPIVLGLGGYLLACLLHKVLPAEALCPFSNAQSVLMLSAESLHWWPLTGQSQMSYTIYPPFDPSFLLPPTSEAACIKLATLLATLLAGRFLRQYESAATSESTISIQSV
jgi:hypothetical protein